MKQQKLSLILKLLVVIFLSTTADAGAQSISPPKAKKEATVFEEYGNKRIDHYYWMNNRDSAVIKHLLSENQYATNILRHTQPLQDKLYEELKGRQANAFSSLPVMLNGYWYYESNAEDKPYPTYCRRKGSMNAQEEVVQDMNELAAVYKTLRYQKPVISPDNQMALISLNPKGNNRYHIKVKNLQTNTFLTDSVADKTYNFPVWTNDNKGFYYVKLDTLTMRPYQLRLHTLGTSQNMDKVLYHEPDSNNYVYIVPSNDRRFLFINSYTPTSNELNYLELNDPGMTIKNIVPRQQNIRYDVINNYGDDLYLYTNHSAPNFKIVKTKAGVTNTKNWQDVIPERKEVYLEPYGVLVKDKLITKQRVDGVAKTNVLNIKNQDSYYIPFDQGIGYTDLSFSNDPLHADSIRLSFTSYAVPDIDYTFDLEKREKKFIRQKQIKGFNTSNYVTKVLMVPVRDGTLVPVSMVYHKAKYKQDGNHPMLLETYSWYNFANDPYFKSDLISLLDRGFVYVYPHARGGAEKGPKWWDDGRRLKRMNTFFDVIDCAQYLVDEKYTSSNRLVASGVSAGGTNIGAMLNLRPDLFKAAIAEVPWLDVITDMKNINVPGVAAEYEEEGNPWIEEEYHYMTKWSPYDNVKRAAYPAVLATASWYDNNVPFYHAAKWVAKVREHNQGTQPVLLLTNLEAGHSGSSNKFDKMKATALKYAFILDVVGIKE